MKNSKYAVLLLSTPIFFILALWISALPHEYAHSTVAWLYGFKKNPFAIYYGHFNWQNIIFTAGIDEDVNYQLINDLGHRAVIGLIGFAGPAVNLFIYLISLILLNLQLIKRHPYGYYFTFWLNVLNLSELVSYIILRSFSTHGDIAHIAYGWEISPWYIFIIGGVLTVWALWHFFSHTLFELFLCLKLDDVFSKLFILTLTTFFIFGASGIRMLLTSYGAFSTLLGIIFLVLVPMLILLTFRKIKQEKP